MHYHNIVVMLTKVFVWIPMVWWTQKVLVFDVNKVLCSTYGLDISCMYAHVNQNIFPAYKVLLYKISPVRFLLRNCNEEICKPHLHLETGNGLTCLARSNFWILWKTFRRIWIDWAEDLRKLFRLRQSLQHIKNFIKLTKYILPAHANSQDHYHLDMVIHEFVPFLGACQYWARQHRKTSLFS